MNSIIISSEIVAGIFTLLILVAILHQYRMIENKRANTFVWFVGAVTAGLFTDAVSYILEGSTAVAALYIFDFLSYAIANFCTIFFVLYVTASIREKNDISRATTIVVFSLSLIDIILILVGAVTGKLYYVENGYTAYGPCKDTPIIVLTANAIAGSKEEYISQGFDGYLSKPIEYAELEKTIRNIMSEDRS